MIRFEDMPEPVTKEDERATCAKIALVHASDCALHNEPYKPNGPCDCRVTELTAPPKRGRGRPPLGTAAMTAAERKRKQRERER